MCVNCGDQPDGPAIPTRRSDTIRPPTLTQLCVPCRNGDHTYHNDGVCVGGVTVDCVCDAPTDLARGE